MDYSAPLTEAGLLQLLDRGAVDVTLHPDGKLRSVRFAPVQPEPQVSTQPMTPLQEEQRRRAVALGAAGGLRRYANE